MIHKPRNSFKTLSNPDLESSGILRLAGTYSSFHLNPKNVRIAMPSTQLLDQTNKVPLADF